MKEQWKRPDSDTTLLVKIEEGSVSPQINIQIPESASVPNRYGCCIRLIAYLVVSTLLVTFVIQTLYLSSKFSNYHQQPSHESESLIVDEPFKSEDNELNFRNKVYGSTTLQVKKEKIIDSSTEAAAFIGVVTTADDFLDNTESSIDRVKEGPIDTKQLSAALESNRLDVLGKIVNEHFLIQPQFDKKEDETLNEFEKQSQKDDSGLVVVIDDSNMLSDEDIRETIIEKHESIEDIQNIVDVLTWQDVLEKALMIGRKNDLSNYENSDEKLAHAKDEFVEKIIHDIENTLESENRVSDEGGKSGEKISIASPWLVDQLVTSNEEDLKYPSEKLDNVIEKIISEFVDIFDRASEENEESDGTTKTTSQENNISMESTNNYDKENASGLENSSISMEKTENLSPFEEKKEIISEENPKEKIEDLWLPIVDVIVASSEEGTSHHEKELDNVVEQLLIDIVSAFEQVSEENQESDETAIVNREKNVSKENSDESNDSDNKLIVKFENPDDEIEKQERLTPSNRKEEKEESSNESTTLKLVESEERESKQKSIEFEEKQAIAQATTEKSMRNIEKIGVMEQFLAKRLESTVGENIELLSWYYENKDNPNFEDDNDKLKVYTAELLFGTNIKQYAIDLWKVLELALDPSDPECLTKLLLAEPIPRKLETFTQNYIVDRFIMKSSMISSVEKDSATPEAVAITLQNINSLDLGQLKNGYDGFETSFSEAHAQISGENSGETEKRHQSILEALRAVASIYYNVASAEDPNIIDDKTEKNSLAFEDFANDSRNNNLEKSDEKTSQEQIVYNNEPQETSESTSEVGALKTASEELISEYATTSEERQYLSTIFGLLKQEAEDIKDQEYISVCGEEEYEY